MISFVIVYPLISFFNCSFVKMILGFLSSIYVISFYLYLGIVRTGGLVLRVISWRVFFNDGSLLVIKSFKSKLRYDVFVMNVLVLVDIYLVKGTHASSGFLNMFRNLAIRFSSFLFQISSLFSLDFSLTQIYLLARNLCKSE